MIRDDLESQLEALKTTTLDSDKARKLFKLCGKALDELPTEKKKYFQPTVQGIWLWWNGQEGNWTSVEVYLQDGVLRERYGGTTLDYCNYEWYPFPIAYEGTKDGYE